MSLDRYRPPRNVTRNIIHFYYRANKRRSLETRRSPRTRSKTPDMLQTLKNPPENTTTGTQLGTVDVKNETSKCRPWLSLLISHPNKRRGKQRFAHHFPKYLSHTFDRDRGDTLRAHVEPAPEPKYLQHALTLFRLNIGRGATHAMSSRLTPAVPAGKHFQFKTPSNKRKVIATKIRCRLDTSIALSLHSR